METIKYKKEIDEILEISFREKWMSDKDFEEFKSAMIKEIGMSYQELYDDLESGIKNGHSLEKQVELIKTIYKKP